MDKYCAKKISKSIVNNNGLPFGLRRNLIVVPNVSYGLFGWGEADIVAVTNAQYMIEGEIKTSINDLKNDFNKRKWTNERCVAEREKQIKRFYYIVPEEIIDSAVKLCGENCGIITYTFLESFYRFNMYRESKINNFAEKMSNENVIKICRLMSFRWWS